VRRTNLTDSDAFSERGKKKFTSEIFGIINLLLLKKFKIRYALCTFSPVTEYCCSGIVLSATVSRARRIMSVITQCNSTCLLEICLDFFSKTNDVNSVYNDDTVHRTRFLIVIR